MVIGLACAWLLARYQFTGILLLEILNLLLLVIPPSVLGYYLVQLFGRDGLFATVSHIDVLFTWQAAALALVYIWGLVQLGNPIRLTSEDGSSS